MYLKQSKNILEEFNFGDNSRSFKEIVGIIHKKYDAIHWHVQYDFFNFPFNGHIESRHI